VLGDSLNRPFFDGTTGISVNFTDPANAVALTKLTNGLITFFGQFAVLGCTDGTIPLYPDGPLDRIHQPLNINNTVFDQFNTLLVAVAANRGVTGPDQQAILAILQSTRQQIVKQFGPPPTSGAPIGPSNKKYEISCGPPPLFCGGGGVYSVRMLEPVLEPTPTADEDIVCFVGDMVTLNFPQALPGHPFQLIDQSGNDYPGAPTAFTSQGDLQFTCTNAMISNPAFYTCTIHGGGPPPTPMSGRILVSTAPPGTPTSEPGPTPPPTDAPTPFPTPPTDAPLPGQITWDVTCPTDTRSCVANPRHYTLTNQPGGSPQLDPTVTCKDKDTITFNFPVSVTSTHPFSIIDATGKKYPTSNFDSFFGPGQVTFVCDAAQLSSLPAYYTCLNHGGMAGQPMTGPILIGQPGQPTAPTRGGQSICDKYVNATGLTAAVLVKKLVVDTVNLIVQDPLVVPFFNGNTPAGSTDFTSSANSNKLNSLVSGLTSFFAGALRCTDGTVPPYTGANLTNIHQRMGISDAVFDEFNKLLIQAAANNGITQADRDSILALLNTLRPQIVNNQGPKAPSPVPPSDPNFHAPNYNANDLVIGIVIMVVILALVAGAVIAAFIFKIGGGITMSGRQHDDYDLL